ncbi:hypothetical protein CEN47_29015, partial [Fischerella thermalis CCMEE 5319]
HRLALAHIILTVPAIAYASIRPPLAHQRMAAKFGEGLYIHTNVVVATTDPVIPQHLLQEGRVKRVVDRRLVVAVVEDVHGVGDSVNDTFLRHPVARQRVIAHKDTQNGVALIGQPHAAGVCRQHNCRVKERLSAAVERSKLPAGVPDNAAAMVEADAHLMRVSIPSFKLADDAIGPARPKDAEIVGSVDMPVRRSALGFKIKATAAARTR